MTRSVLARLERIIQNRIAAKKDMGQDYDFMMIKRSVLNENRNDLGNERDAYSSELSKRFGSEGGKKAALSKAAAKLKKKEDDQTIKDAIRSQQIQESMDLIIDDLNRSGNIELFV